MISRSAANSKGATAAGSSARRRLTTARIGGLAGICFAATVIVQNAVRANFPAADATANQVLSYYADHRLATIVLAALFPIGCASLITYVGVFLSRVAHGAARVPAIAGAFGAAGIVGNFTLLVASDSALSGYIHRGAANPAVVEGLWVFHNAVFGVLLASIGVALAGFTTAAAMNGLLARGWKAAGLVAGTLLLGAAATTPAIIDGSPTMYVGVAGFLGWIAFLLATSVKLLRRG